MRRIVTVVAFAFGLVSAARAADSDLIKRGEYLARTGDCIACHTKPGGEPLAGGLALNTPYGPIYSPNITPDKETGIGGWSDEQFYRAMHDGIDDEGKYLYPAFPFPWYTKVSRADVLAIKAYLFSLKPINHPNKPPGLSFPYDIRTSLAAWRALFFKAAPDKPAPEGESVERGAYLVEGLGHCGECHNHNNVRGASDWSGKYEGGAIEGWFAPNITSDDKQGIGAWSVNDLATYLKSGAAPGKGVALGPMHETIDDSLSHLKDEDLRSIALYLKSIPPKQEFSNATGAYAQKGAPGENLYVERCSSCHGLEGQGSPGRVPALAHNGAVNAEGPQNVISAVLGGLAPEHGLGPMPAVGANLSDEDIGRIADYVRNRFGNAAPAYSGPDKIAKLRETTHTVMAPASAEDCGKSDSPPVSLASVEGSKGSQETPAVDALLATLKPALAKSVDAVVADLTKAYCRASFDESASSKQRAERIGQFAVLLYSRAHALATN